MAGPLQQAGAVSEPSEYATLAMDRQMTGLWTQRSLLRDADVPYLQGKFYGASRYDSLCDGLNREISARLTSIRRPGSSVWNTSDTAKTLPQLKSFGVWKYIQDHSEVVRVLADSATGGIYDVSSNQVSEVLTKSKTDAAMRFLGVNTEMFLADGSNPQALLAGSTKWKASTTVDPGTLIVSGAAPGNIQMALGGITMGIVKIQAISTIAYQIWFDLTQTTNQFPNLIGCYLSFSELTSVPSLNGTSLPVSNVISTSLGILTVQTAGLTPGNAVNETGTATTGNGTTGETAPTFSASKLDVVADSGQQWKCYGTALIPWGLKIPSQSLVIDTNGQARMWSSLTVLSFRYAIMDTNGNIQVAMNTIAGSEGVYKTGNAYPKWSSGAPAGQFDMTIDGTIVWWNLGSPGSWYGSQKYYVDPNQGVSCILDSNQNLQQCTDGSGGTSGSAQPTWSTTIGGTTIDGPLTWTCLGPGTIVSGSQATYGCSLHGIDGSVSTSSSTVTIKGYILGPTQANPPANPSLSITIKGIQNYGISGDASGVDQIWIWRTAQGQSTLIMEDQIPVDDIQIHLAPPTNPSDGYNFLPYYEYGITDTSTDGNGALNAFIQAPVAQAGNPPPSSIVNPIFHVQRVWGIVDNTVVYSDGPDSITGNGNTQFSPLNYIPYLEQPKRLIPFTTNNGGILVIGTANTYVILGTGTQSNPFYTTIYMPGVGILNYDAVDIIGSTIYLMTSKGKLASIDPSAGYMEIGFPIGDQFSNVTTGVGVFDGFETTAGGALYDPLTARVTWHEQESGDTAIYVSDGRWGWFRYSPVTAPESGYVWSPRASLLGGCSFVQSVEVAPGINKLLIAPYGGGPILMRDASVSTDWVQSAIGATKAFPFPSYQTFGNITLCESGEIAEVAHIAIKSTAVGAKPSVAVLFGELAATADVPFDVLHVTAPDPPDLPPSKTIYSDRYSTMQNGVCPLCEHLQLKIDYGMQAYPDELLKHSIYGAHHAERKQQ